MKTSKPIQIFKPGKHTAMSGAVLNFTEADMAACAAAYDPAKHEAPLVVGHPKSDKPRFGGVGSLSYVDGILDASPKDVDPEFAEWVNKKFYNKVSASFYTPDSPQNPVPGVYYLRHVGFLGAQPPAIKGLNQHGISFSDAEEGVVEFADWGDQVNASMWRRLRDWMIGEKGLDVADSVIPDYAVTNLEDDARTETDPAPLPAFTEPQPKGDEMSAEEKARLAALEAENADLKADSVKRANAARHADHAAFSEGLIKAGKLLPAQKDVCVATMDFMAGQETVVEFGEGDAKKPLVDGFKEFLQALPKQVEFGELAKAEGEGETVEFAAPGGYSVDADRLEIHNKALAYQAAHPNTTYQTAVNAVGGN